MVSIHWNWPIWPIMLKSAIFSCFPYILYMKRLKITFCLLPTCSTPQRKLKFAGELSFTIRMIFWNFGDVYIFSKLKWHDSQGCASDRNRSFLILWNIPRDTQMTIKNHSQPNLTSVFKVFDLGCLFDSFSYCVKIYQKWSGRSIGLLYTLRVTNKMCSTFRIL